MSVVLLALMGLSQLEPIELPKHEPIAGIVVDPEGKPIAGAQVYLVGFIPRDVVREILVLGESTSDNAGRFTVAVALQHAERDGRLPYLTSLWVYRTGLAWKEGDLKLRPSIRPWGPLQIGLQAAEPRHIQVVDPENKPIGDARLSVRSPRSFSPRFAHSMAARFAVTTDVEGRAVLTDFSSESLGSLEVTTERYGIQQMGIAPSVNGEVETVVLHPVGTLSGRFVSDDPAAVRNRQFTVMTRTAYRSYPRPPGHTGLAFVTTDADGHFEAPDLAMGSVLFLRSGRDTSPYYPRFPGGISIEAGQRTETEIPLDRGIHAYGFLRERGTGRPLAHAVVSLNYGFGSHALTDQNGRYEMDLTPGKSSLHPEFANPYVRPADIPTPMADITAEGREVELPLIEVVKAKSMRGQVVGEDGQPIADALVKASWVEWTVGLEDTPVTTLASASGRSGSDGAFVIDGLPADQLALTAHTHDACTLMIQRVSISDPEPVTLAISAAHSMTFSGRFLDELGKPIVDAVVLIQEKTPFENSKGELLFMEASSVHTDGQGRFQTPRVLHRGATYRVFVRSALGSWNYPPQPFPDHPAVGWPDVKLQTIRPGVALSQFQHRDLGTTVDAIVVINGTNPSVDVKQAVSRTVEPRLILAAPAWKLEGPDAWKPDLPTVGVTGNLKGDARIRRHVERVRLVNQEDVLRVRRGCLQSAQVGRPGPEALHPG